MTYQIPIKKQKEYVRVSPYYNLIELKKAKLNTKTFETKIGVERDCIGRILIYDKEGKLIKIKPEEVVELDGKTFYIE